MRLIDGLINVIANLGTGRDKASSSVYTTGQYNPIELFNTYRASWLAKAIVDYPAEDSTRKWRQWRAEKDQISAIEAVEKRLGLKQKTQECLIAARLYGGAAIYINTLDADQSKPLRAESEVKSLIVLTRNNLSPAEAVRDIYNPYYGGPEFYSLSSGDGNEKVDIHASRFVLMLGAPLPSDSTSGTNQGWGDSVLTATMDAIRNTDATMANIASLVFEAKVDVFKFQGFAKLLADSKNDDMLSRRLNAQAAMKGINGAVVIDKEDEYEQKSASFAGLPDVAAKFQDTVSGASGIPVTRLYGRASVGLSGSGDGDERVYYDRIGHQQATRIGPALSGLDDCILYMAIGAVNPDVYYEWRPLRQMTENERADIFSKTATAARALAGPSAGVLLPLDALSDALSNEFIEQGMLPGLAQALETYGTLAEQGLDPADEIILDARRASSGDSQ